MCSNKRCIMCVKGYYMTPEYTCRVDSEWDVVVAPVEEILPDIYIVDTTSTHIRSCLITLIISTLLLLR